MLEWPKNGTVQQDDDVDVQSFEVDVHLDGRVERDFPTIVTQPLELDRTGH